MIKVQCVMCLKELEKPGGLIFSPPDDDSMVEKSHICQQCYRLFVKNLTHIG